MSMIKVIQPAAQDFSEPVSSLIKISSRGLVGSDRQAFVKRAGAEFADKISNIKFAKDEIPVHLIAIGATEDYGPNRNGDGFTRETCKKDHPTFEKLARFYRDHANKNPAKSFGLVKASHYNETMKRIELICALNGSKEAADRNGGLIADKEMAKLASGNDIPVSMACKIPFDTCSACGNVAKTRAEYCDSVENGGHCKAGGLKHNIGRVLEDGHILHADNTKCAFFDISHVFRPADRIAYVSGKLEKAASAGIISGAELAEQLGVTAPLSLELGSAPPRFTQAQFDALNWLTAAEKSAAADSWTQTVLASSPAVQPPLDAAPSENIKLSEALLALADSGVVLPPRDFLMLTVKSANAKLVDAVVNALPNVFSKLANDQDIVQKLENNIYRPARSASSAARVWAEKVALTHSVLPAHVEKRAYLAALRGAELTPFSYEKQASSSAECALAEHYALYKIAAVATICEKYGNNWLTTNHCVLQNYVK